MAGALFASFYYVFPEVGGNFGLIAFVVVALGGFGSVPGAFIAGIIVGLVEVISGYLIAPSLKFMFVLASIWAWSYQAPGTHGKEMRGDEKRSCSFLYCSSCLLASFPSFLRDPFPRHL